MKAALSAVRPKPMNKVSHGDMSRFTVRYAVVYAPMPTKAACPKEVRPPTPVSSTRPSTGNA